MPYLFVHFKEKRTPDGEQVHFAVSRDGLSWEEINHGNPVLWSYKGDLGTRDYTITRCKNKFVILATDLCLAYGMRGKYHGSWEEISINGSKNLVMWKSEDLVHWSEQEMITLGDDNFGCRWAPEITYDKEREDYIVHFSSPHRCNNYGPKGIYYSRTKDFQNFEEAKLLYRKEDSGVIDSCIVEENGVYYLFVKSEGNPSRIILLKSFCPTGPFERIYAFDEEMSRLQAGSYEAPTAFMLPDKRWCLMLDFCGVRGRMQGYVPFVCSNLSTGIFEPADDSFSFPYRFKHGTVLSITDEEYTQILEADFYGDK